MKIQGERGTHHQRHNESLRLAEGVENGAHADAAHTETLLALLTGLEDSASTSDFALFFRQELGRVGRVGQVKEDDDGHDERRQALDEEQEAPVGQGGMARRDAVGQSAGKRRGQRCSRQEDAAPEAELVSLIKERQQIRHAGAERGLGHGQEPAAGHQPGPVERGRLQGRCQAPNHEVSSGPDVRRHNLPKDGGPLKDDVGDVKDGQQPLVVGVVEAELLAHAGGLGIANVGAVEEGEQIADKHECHEDAVHFAQQALFGGRVDVDIAVAFRSGSPDSGFIVVDVVEVVGGFFIGVGGDR